MTKFCMHCGTQFEEGTKFCPGCGKMVEEAQAQYVPPAEPPPGPQYAPPPAPQYAPPPPAPQQYAPPPPGPQQYAPPPPGPQQYAPPAGQYAQSYAGAPAAPVKKKFPKWLIAVIIVAACVAALFIVPALLTGNAADKDYFKIGSDQVPSVKLVLGEKRDTTGVSSSTEGGVTTKVISYSVAENQNREMLTYAKALMDKYGYINTTDYNFNGPAGSGFKFAKESVEAGYVVIVQIDYDAKGYTLTLMRGKGTITVNDAPQGGGGASSDNGGSSSGGGSSSDNGGTSSDNGGASSDNGGPPVALSGTSDIFDFTALPESLYPRGDWSVNQLAGKYEGAYGALADATGYYYADYGAVWAYARFAKAAVSFAPDSADAFSFSGEAFEDGQYPLSSVDKDRKLPIVSIQISSADIKLPHGIKLLQSTKDDVKSVYPVAPYMEYSADEEGYYIDILGWQYAFPGEYPGGDVGTIEYHFDQQGVLDHFIISWQMYDL